MVLDGIILEAMSIAAGSSDWDLDSYRLMSR